MRETVNSSAQAAMVARLVAARGMERYEADGSWPSGAGAPTPGLMIGLAGVGHFYLRLARPTTPSILRIDVDSFVTAHIEAPAAAAVTGTPVAEVALTR